MVGLAKWHFWQIFCVTGDLLECIGYNRLLIDARLNCPTMQGTAAGGTTNGAVTFCSLPFADCC